MHMHVRDEGQECKAGSSRVWLLVGKGKGYEDGQCNLYTCMKIEWSNLLKLF
jgi:hypothetical protein